MKLSKVVIAIDSFKGSLSSLEAAEAAQKGITKVFPDCEVTKVCIADGGEGTLEALVGMLGGERIKLNIHDPLMRQIQTQYGIVDHGHTAIMEMASACGLTLLSPKERNPMLTTTYGLGEMIADATARGCRKILIGIGGSATNDGGCGMMHALGYRFLDSDGTVVTPTGGRLADIARIDATGVVKGLDAVEFTVACDVDNPLYGPRGAAWVYARQKGANDTQIEQLDRGLQNLAQVIREFNGADVAQMEGAGAAGGLGAGLKAFLHATLTPGIKMVLNAIGFDQMVTDADLVITGEGRLDSQTVMGKAPSGVLEVARRHNVPVIAIGGAVETDAEDKLIDSGFAAVFAIVRAPISLCEAMQTERAKANITSTVRQIALTLKLS